jgi:spore coat protein U-like protein
MPCLSLAPRLALAALLFSAGAAQALCLPAACNCTVATTSVAFGAYNPLAFGNTDSTGSVKVSCGGVAGLLIPFNIALSAGSSASYAGRRLRSGGNSLAYNLYTDASYATLWGDGSSATQVVSSSVTLDVLGLSPAQSFVVYGRIPGRQTAAVPGSYSDTISVTLTYY